MDIKVDSKDDIKVVSVSGEITFSTSPDLRKTLVELVEQGNKKVIINMKEVGYIDSSGMATMVEILQQIKGIEGELKLAEASEKIQELFEMVRLKDIFDITDTEEEALSSF